MRLEDIKVGMKVKLLSKHGCGDNYNDIESWYDNRKRYDSVKFIKEQGYGVVEKICGNNEIYIKYCFDSTLCGWYFTANDLEPYEEPKTINIETLFGIGDKCYTVKKMNVEKICSYCEGTGTVEANIKGINVNINCIECGGSGHFSSKEKIYEPTEEYEIEKIKIDIDKNGEKIKYRLSNQNKVLNRTKDMIFKTLEEAQTWCYKENVTEKLVDIKDIAIQDSFKQTCPSSNKIKEKIDYYNKNGVFDKKIIIDKNNILIDGYISYLIAKMYDIQSVECVIV